MICAKGLYQKLPILHIVVDAIEASLTQINGIPLVFPNIDWNVQML